MRPEQSARLAVARSRPVTGAIPALRRDLEVRARHDGAVEVRDPRLRQIFTIDGEDWSVAAAFDGRSDAAALAQALRPRLALSPKDVGELADDFDRLHLLDTPRAKAARPAEDTVAPPAILGPDPGLSGPLVVEPEARWACNACGACCHDLAVELTPVEDARLQRDLYTDILGDEDYAQEVFLSAGEPAKRVLRQRPERNNACIFLLEDGRCVVHARQGMAAKPYACQTFPLLVVKPPYRPARLGVRVSCRSMSRTFEAGPPLTRELAHSERVFAEIPIHRIPARFELFGAELSFRAFEAITDELQAILALEGPTAAALAQIDRRLLGGRVRRATPRWGLRLARYVRDEAEGTIPAGEGAYRLALRRVARGADTLAAMAARLPAPAVPEDCARLLVGQLGHALWLGGALNAPDAGVGLVALMLALTGALHATGPRGTPAEAEAAFDVFSAPLLETNDHLWPILEAIDPRLTRRIREEMS